MAKEINIERVIERSIYLVIEKLKKLDRYDIESGFVEFIGAMSSLNKCDDGELVKWSDIEEIIKELEE